MNGNIERAGVERVASTLLRHLAPKDRREAEEIVRVRLGCYGLDDALVVAVVDSHFGPSAGPRSRGERLGQVA